jgi:hypothetical protein
MEGTIILSEQPIKTILLYLKSFSFRSTGLENRKRALDHILSDQALRVEEPSLPHYPLAPPSEFHRAEKDFPYMNK